MIAFTLVRGTISDHFLKPQFPILCRLSAVCLLMGSCESSHFLIVKCVAPQVANY